MQQAFKFSVILQLSVISEEAILIFFLTSRKFSELSFSSLILVPSLLCGKLICQLLGGNVQLSTFPCFELMIFCEFIIDISHNFLFSFHRVKLIIEEIEKEESLLLEDLASMDRKFAEHYNVRLLC